LKWSKIQHIVEGTSYLLKKIVVVYIVKLNLNRFSNGILQDVTVLISFIKWSFYG